MCHHGRLRLRHTSQIPPTSNPDLQVNSQPSGNISEKRQVMRSAQDVTRHCFQTVSPSKLISRKSRNFLNTDLTVFPEAVGTNTSVSGDFIAGIKTTRGQKTNAISPTPGSLLRKTSIYPLPGRYCFTEQLGLPFPPNTALRPRESPPLSKPTGGL